jgi:hypothetical protein
LSGEVPDACAKPSLLGIFPSFNHCAHVGLIYNAYRRSLLRFSGANASMLLAHGVRCDL